MWLVEELKEGHCGPGSKVESSAERSRRGGEGPDHTGPVARGSIWCFLRIWEVSMGLPQDDALLAFVILKEHQVQTSAVQ